MSPIDKLIAADRANGVRIAIIGDAMTDRYIHGRLESCQESCPKFIEERFVEVPGGAANAARSLSHWDAAVACFSNNKYIQPLKTRFIVDGKHMWRHDNDEMDSDCVLTEKRRTVFESLRERDDIAGVLISDYSKGFVTPAFIRQLIDLCHERHVHIVCDAKREPEVYEGAILKCNSDYVMKHGAVLFRPSTVITDGSRKPTVVTDDGAEDYGVEHVIPCVSHVGAGDCFAAHLTLALAHGFTLEEAAAIAHSAGRIYVQHPHNRAPWPHEIARDFEPILGKVVAEPDLSALRQSIPGRLVFTNGCFDLLHCGHLHLLQEAKKCGDVLVVGVNDDASTRRLKGPSRPTHTLDNRTTMLASLECVDWVVPFSDDTPVEVMKALKPDVLVKADFAQRNKAGDELVKEVKLIQPLPGQSTTATVQKVLMQMTANQSRPAPIPLQSQ